MSGGVLHAALNQSPSFPVTKHTASLLRKRQTAQSLVQLCHKVIRLAHTLSIKLRIVQFINKHCRMTAMATSGAGHCDCVEVNVTVEEEWCTLKDRGSTA